MRSRKDPIYDGSKEKLKVLLINPFGIGDLIFSTPLIGILKKALPRARLYYICNKRTYEVIENAPQLDGIYIFEKDDYRNLWKKSKTLCLRKFISFLAKIRKEGFDLAIDMSMGHQYSFFLKLINVPQRVGFDYKGRGRFLTKKIPFDGFNEKPIGEYYKDLLRLLGLAADSDEPTRIWLTDEDRHYATEFFKNAGLRADDILIGLAPGGGISFGKQHIAYKRWPREKFAELADYLIKEMNAKVILIWGPGEKGLAGGIRDIMDRRPLIAPGTTVRQMAALMERCSCIVCNDSGPLHVAVAAGAKTVSIFGPSDEKVYGQYPNNKRHIAVARDMVCRPCYKEFRVPDCQRLDCLKGLDARSLFLKIEGHMKGLRLDVKA